MIGGLERGLGEKAGHLEILGGGKGKGEGMGKEGGRGHSDGDLGGGIYEMDGQEAAMKTLLAISQRGYRQSTKRP